MSKATFNLLRNDEEWNKITEPSKKQLVNWLYKTSQDAVDFDSSAYLNELN
jgi:hypothetical protein